MCGSDSSEVDSSAAASPADGSVDEPAATEDVDSGDAVGAAVDYD